ncbi:hypothetical protein [Halobaculum sp. EA56]|uniref:hypothetical protein n=1 Tax=Halobaculum sp. EA56 TaxID=3421648 RepID=UPI003EBB543C
MAHSDGHDRTGSGGGADRTHSGEAVTGFGAADTGGSGEQTAEQAAEHRSVTDAADLLGVLDSDACRDVLRVLGDDSFTAKEIQRRGDIPLSTVYRSVNELVTTPLLEETTRLSDGGYHASEYSRPVGALVITFEPDAQPAVVGTDGLVLHLSV